MDKLDEVLGSVSSRVAPLFKEQASAEEFVRKRYGPKLETTYQNREGKKSPGVDHIIGKLREADPSPNGSYTPWLAKQYVNHQFKMEDTPRLKEDLTTFHKHKAKLGDMKDISKHPDLKSLYHHIEKFQTKAAEPDSAEDKKYLDKGHATLVHKDADTQIVAPHTKEAAQHFGTGTKWCIAGKKDNMFDDYNDQHGVLYMMKHKGKKYAFHYTMPGEEEGDFMDDKDQPVPSKERQRILEGSKGLQKLHAHKMKNGWDDLMKRGD